MDRLSNVTLDRLVPSNGGINSRKTHKLDGIKELAKNIDEIGLIQPLAVRKLDDGKFQIVDGHRRYAALKELDAGDGTETVVPVMLVRNDDDASAAEVSLAANIMRLPLHPADQFEAFAALAAAGRTVEEIAEHFALKKNYVKQRLALGNLIPDFLNAYRKEELSLSEIEPLAAASVKRQKQIWKMLKKGEIKPWNIIGIMRKDTVDADSILARTIGQKEYEAAGGEIETDLFKGEVRWISKDVIAKLEDRAKTKIEEDLKAEGWRWVRWESQLPPAWHGWQKLTAAESFKTPEDEKRYEQVQKRRAEIDEIDGTSISKEADDKLIEEYDALEREEQEIVDRMVSAWTDEHRQRGGVVIRKDYSLTYGVVSPEDRKQDERKAKDKARTEGLDDAGPGPKVKSQDYSNALIKDLENWLTVAVQRAVAKHPDVALDLLLDALAAPGDLHSRYSDKRPISLESPHRFESDEPAFATPFSEDIKKAQSAAKGLSYESSNKNVYAVLAVFTAAMLKKHTVKSPLVKELDETVTAELHKVWKPDKAFLERLTRDQINQALKETGNAQLGSNAKKSEMVQIAEKKLAGTGWLPKVIRPTPLAKPKKVKK